jgi:response regulator RpfG family c-di-GMP phosphodiesterase
MGIAMSIIVASLGLAIFYSTQELGAFIRTDLSMLGKVANELVSNELDLIRVDADKIAESCAALEDDRISAYLADALRESRVGFNSLAYADKNGIIARQGNNYGQDVLDQHQDLVDRALSGITTITTSYVESDGALTFHVVSKVKDGHILIGTLPGDTFSKLVSNFDIWDGGRVVLFDDQGVIVGSVRENSVMSRRAYFNEVFEDPSKADAAAAIRTMLAGGVGHATYVHDNEMVYTVFMPIRDNATNWSLVVLAPEANGPVAKEVRAVTINSIITAVFALLACMLATRLLLRHFDRLAEAERGAVAARDELAELNRDLEARVVERTRKITQMQRSFLVSVTNLVESRDGGTGEHIQRSQLYLGVLYDAVVEHSKYADEAKAWDKDMLLMASMLHDVGKISVSDTILNKPSELDPKEFNIMEQHVGSGMKIIQAMAKGQDGNEIIEYARVIVRSHHEHWDGSGYPEGLSGAKIPLMARMMAIADVYDALVSERPYKHPMTPKEAAKVIVAGSGTHFDPELVRVFELVKQDFASIALTSNLDQLVR